MNSGNVKREIAGAAEIAGELLSLLGVIVVACILVTFPVWLAMFEELSTEVPDRSDHAYRIELVNQGGEVERSFSRGWGEVRQRDGAVEWKSDNGWNTWGGEYRIKQIAGGESGG